MASGAQSPNRSPLEALIGRRIAGATSSLACFAVTLEDGGGLLAEPRDDTPPVVAVSTPPASALPAASDAVCAVDWSWIIGSAIRQAALVDGKLQLALDPAGPLTVSAALWQGQPFLAFQPYRAPASAAPDA